jgi:hypothetical protein
VGPAQFGGRGDEHLKRRVARAGAHPGQRGVHSGGAVFDRDDGVGHPQRQVVVGVHTDLRCRIQGLAQCIDAFADVSHGHRTAGIDDVDAGGAVALHECGLLGKCGRGAHVAHHQKADGVHAQLAGGGDVLGGDVGFGAVGRHSYYRRAGAVGVFEVVHATDTG